jgi:predicted nucleic acid-binding protein
VKYLLDTNVISEVRKSHGNARVKSWFDATPPDDLYMSVLTVGEIRRGIERLRRRDPAQANMFDEWLGGLLQEFAERLLLVTAEIAVASNERSCAPTRCLLPLGRHDGGGVHAIVVAWLP